jgi:hypothetical protein
LRKQRSFRKESEREKEEEEEEEEYRDWKLRCSRLYILRGRVGKGRYQERRS